MAAAHPSDNCGQNSHPQTGPKVQPQVPSKQNKPKQQEKTKVNSPEKLSTTTITLPPDNSRVHSQSTILLDGTHLSEQEDSQSDNNK